MCYSTSRYLNMQIVSGLICWGLEMFVDSFLCPNSIEVNGIFFSLVYSNKKVYSKKFNIDV